MALRWTRRRFLQGAGLTAFAAALPTFALLPRRARAAPPADPVLVLVHLEGGNDGLNTVVPLNNVGAPQRSFYDALRPNLHVGVSALAATLIGNDAIGTGLGLHPAMTGLKDLYDLGVLAVVNGVGFSASPRSHADAQSAWFAGDRGGLAATVGTGWAGRAADTAFDAGTTPSLGFALSAHPALAGATTKALALRDLADLALPDDPQFPDLPARRVAWETSYAADAGDSALVARIRAHGASVLAHTDVAGAIELTGWGSALESGTSELHRQLHQTVSIVRHDALLPDDDTGLRLFHLTQPGYATNADQGATDGKHAANLLALSDALAALWTDLVALDVQDRVLVLVYSEFGRRAAQNAAGGDAGTDNGAAGPVLALGGLVAGGVYGRVPALTALDANGGLAPHTDFRQVYATVLERFLGEDPDDVLFNGPFALVDFLPA